MLADPTRSHAANALDQLADLKLTKPDGGAVYVLGTCHVSEASGSKAAELVRTVRPTTVVVELDPSRAHVLRETREERSDGDACAAQEVSLEDVGSAMGSVLTDWTSLIGMSYDALRGLETPRVGVEFRAAAAEANALGADIVFGDRDVDLTALRLRRLVPLYELALAMVWDDPGWIEAQALQRHAAAQALQTDSEALCEAVGMAAGSERDQKLRSLSASIRAHAERADDAAVRGYADATLSGLLRRFWNKEVIGPHERQTLREALGAQDRLDPTDNAPLPPSMRRILLDERDLVLAHALHRQRGAVVVGVVGRSHLAGIEREWATLGEPQVRHGILPWQVSYHPTIAGILPPDPMPNLSRIRPWPTPSPRGMFPGYRVSGPGQPHCHVACSLAPGPA